MKRFRSYVRIQIRLLSVYRFENVMRCLYGLLAMYAVRALWIAIWKDNSALVERDLPEMITYAMAAMALDIVFYHSGDNSIHTYMSHQVRNGNIDADLLCPMDFQQMMLYRNASRILVLFFMNVLPVTAFAVLFMGFQLPASPGNTVIFFLSLFLAYFAVFGTDFLLGLLAMGIKNTRYVSWSYRAVSDFFSGKLVPLWLFPSALRAVSLCLPFRCIYDIPLNIWIGSYSAAETARALLLQLFWAAALLLLGRACWHSVQKHYSVQGG